MRADRGRCEALGVLFSITADGLRGRDYVFFCQIPHVLLPTRDKCAPASNTVTHSQTTTRLLCVRVYYIDKGLEHVIGERPTVFRASLFRVALAAQILSEEPHGSIILGLLALRCACCNLGCSGRGGMPRTGAAVAGAGRLSAGTSEFSLWRSDPSGTGGPMSA